MVGNEARRGNSVGGASGIVPEDGHKYGQALTDPS